MSKTFRRALAVAAIVAACTLVTRADIAKGDAELQFQLATLLFDETRYQEALDAYAKASQSDDPVLAKRARKGKIRTELRVAEFWMALQDAEQLRADFPTDAEALSLHGDALWSSGLFDESDRAYRDALTLAPGSSRARFGLARSLATRSQLSEALDEALIASAAAPRDGDIHAGLGEIYEQLNRYDEAANAFTNHINLLPNKDRSDKAAWSRTQVRFLEAFEGKTPSEIDDEDAHALHTVPFRLIKDKIVVKGSVNGGRVMDFILDTGSEETVISRETAQHAGVQPITYTLSAGVGEVGLRGLQLARLDRLNIGTLEVRNVPVLIKNPALRGIPKREGESFSPLTFGMSMKIDYQNRLLLIGRDLPKTGAEIALPMRVHRLPMVRGMVNTSHPAYFVVDTGGQVMSISTDTAGMLEKSTYRRIPLQVYGTSGWDRDAFLLPGVDLNFNQIEYRNTPMVVLNLRAPSILLGFQLGGIIGHKFLSSYRVSMDMARSELRMEKF